MVMAGGGIKGKAMLHYNCGQRDIAYWICNLLYSLGKCQIKQNKKIIELVACWIGGWYTSK